MNGLFDKRYDLFLNNYEFYSNCISFRIKSSKELEKFKNVQSFQLNQLVNGKFYFAEDRREILLLKYDMWSRWLYEVENLFIELYGISEDKIASPQDVNFVVKLAYKTSEKYKNIITTNKNFDTTFVKVWLEMHEFALEHLITSVSGCQGSTFEKFFVKIVDFLCIMMQYTLIELYELDSLFCKKIISCKTCSCADLCPQNKRFDGCEKIPFIIIGPLAMDCYTETNTCLTVERIKVYKRHFQIDEVYIKNYTENLILEDLIRKIEDCGIKINYRKSIVR